MSKSKRFYLDTNVYISCFDEELGKEIGGGFRPLGEFASNFFKFVSEHGHILVLSEFFFDEAKKKYYVKEEILDFFYEKKVNVELVDYLDEDKKEGNIIKRNFDLHKADAKHTAIAIRVGCDCIVTFNEDDFKKVKSLIPYIMPEQF